MTTSIVSLFLNAAISLSGGEYYEVGDVVADFELKNVDGQMVSFADFEDAKGFVVVFTCNHCPVARAYQDRIIALDQHAEQLGYQLLAISSINPADEPRDSYDNMVTHAQNNNYTFPYLYDGENQKVLKKFGAQYTPTAFLIEKQSSGELVLRYAGAIDDNSGDAAAVTRQYVVDAIFAIEEGQNPQPSFTRAIGCDIPYMDGVSASR